MNRAWGVTSCRAWVRFYTFGLPPSARSERRDEIASDLYEHALDAQDEQVSAAQFSIVVLARTLFGIPADLSWRYATARALRQQRQRALREDSDLTRDEKLIELVAMAGRAICVMFAGIATYAAWTGRWNSTTVAVIATTSVVLGGVGFATRRRAPVLGAVASIVGIVLSMVIMYWNVPLHLAGIVTMILIVRLASRPTCPPMVAEFLNPVR